MARFTYHGPVQTIPLAVGSTKGKDGAEISKFEDIDFVPGRETPDLPADHPIIAAMIERKLLRPVATENMSSKTTKPAKNDAAKQGEK